MSDDRIGDEFREWDAAYVLGMLSPDDRRAYERHLSTCDACSSALAELAGLPGLLGTLSTAEAIELTTTDAAGQPVAAPEPGLVQHLAAASVRRRRRTRRRVGAASVVVAAGLAVCAFFVGTSIASPTPTASPAAAIAMTAVGDHAVAAELTVTPKKWGTRLDWNCSYPHSHAAGPGSSAPSEIDYDLVVTETSGAELVVASWSAYGEAAKNLTASTRVATGDIRSVEIRLEGSTTTLARAEL